MTEAVKGAIEELLRQSHRARCLLLGCYYGSADAMECIFCGTAKPRQDKLRGKSPLASVRD